MTKISLKELTPTQRTIWEMRYRYGWRVKQIAMKMGTSVPNVSQILGRAMVRAGLPRRRNIRIIRTKPRLATVHSLSDVFDY